MSTDRFKVLGTTTQTARERHWCDHCMTQIEPGDYYERQVRLNGTRVIVFKHHLEPDCPLDEDDEFKEDLEWSEPVPDRLAA